MRPLKYALQTGSLSVRNDLIFYLKFVWRLLSKCVYACFYKEIHIFPGRACAEYNSGGKTIQRNFKVYCEECPIVYASVQSFLCKWLKIALFCSDSVFGR